MKVSTKMSIEKSGTGISNFHAAVNGSRILTRAVVMYALVSLLLGSSALAVQGSGGGVSSVDGDFFPTTLISNENLITVAFTDGYRMINGYGYLQDNYSNVSLYSLEYVHVIDLEDDDNQSLLVQGSGGGTASEGGGGTAPVQGSGGGAPTSGDSSEQLQPWGIAEIVFSERGTADVIVYRFNAEGTLEEVGVHSGVEVR